MGHIVVVIIGWWRIDSKNSPGVEGDEEEDYEDEEGDDELICQKRKMVVSFEEIGWGDWIISPKTFDASYCAGECPHPLKKVSPELHFHGSFQKLHIKFSFPKCTFLLQKCP